MHRCRWAGKRATGKVCRDRSAYPNTRLDRQHDTTRAKTSQCDTHTFSSTSARASAAENTPLSALARLAARAFAAASAEGRGRGHGASWRYCGRRYEWPGPAASTAVLSLRFVRSPLPVRADAVDDEGLASTESDCCRGRSCLSWVWCSCACRFRSMLSGADVDETIWAVGKDKRRVVSCSSFGIARRRKVACAEGSDSASINLFTFSSMPLRSMTRMSRTRGLRGIVLPNGSGVLG